MNEIVKLLRETKELRLIKLHWDAAREIERLETELDALRAARESKEKVDE